MKIAIAALMTLFLAFYAGGESQLCKHHSGSTHIFFDSKTCDGEHRHAESNRYDDEHGQHGQHDDHGDHGDDHSQHEVQGEHHEPCSHETISNGEDLASQPSQSQLSLSFQVQRAPLEDLNQEQWRTGYSEKQTQYVTRGPPDERGPQGHFQSTIRLLI